MVSQEFPFPGKRKLLGDMAVKEAEAEFQMYQQVQLGVVSRLTAQKGFELFADSIPIYLQREGRLHPEYVTGDDAKLFGSLAIPVGQVSR